MKVRDLIKKLKTMDQDATVCTRDHDNSEDEISGWVKYVQEQHSSEITDYRKAEWLVVITC